jgi:hypothetical protein
MADLAVKITKTEQGSRADAGGTFVSVYRVTFMVGDHGPFVEEFTRGDFIPENVRAKTEAVASTIRAISA